MRQANESSDLGLTSTTHLSTFHFPSTRAIYPLNHIVQAPSPQLFSINSSVRSQSCPLRSIVCNLSKSKIPSFDELMNRKSVASSLMKKSSSECFRHCQRS